MPTFGEAFVQVVRDYQVDGRELPKAAGLPGPPPFLGPGFPYPSMAQETAKDALAQMGKSGLRKLRLLLALGALSGTVAGGAALGRRLVERPSGRELPKAAGLPELKAALAQRLAPSAPATAGSSLAHLGKAGLRGVGRLTAGGIRSLLGMLSLAAVAGTITGGATIGKRVAERSKWGKGVDEMEDEQEGAPVVR